MECSASGLTPRHRVCEPAAKLVDGGSKHRSPSPQYKSCGNRFGGLARHVPCVATWKRSWAPPSDQSTKIPTGKLSVKNLCSESFGSEFRGQPRSQVKYSLARRVSIEFTGQRVPPEAGRHVSSHTRQWPTASPFSCLRSALDARFWPVRRQCRLGRQRRPAPIQS